MLALIGLIVLIMLIACGNSEVLSILKKNKNMIIGFLIGMFICFFMKNMEGLEDEDEGDKETKEKLSRAQLKERKLRRLAYMQGGAEGVDTEEPGSQSTGDADGEKKDQKEEDPAHQVLFYDGPGVFVMLHVDSDCEIEKMPK